MLLSFGVQRITSVLQLYINVLSIWILIKTQSQMYKTLHNKFITSSWFHFWQTKLEIMNQPICTNILAARLRSDTNSYNEFSRKEFIIILTYLLPRGNQVYAPWGQFPDNGE